MSSNIGGEPRSVSLSPNGKLVYVGLVDRSQIAILDTTSLREVARFEVQGEPRAVLPSVDGKGLFITDFDGDRVMRLNAATGRIEAISAYINRPSCLAVSQDGSEVYTVSFRTGEIVVLDEQCRILRSLKAPSQLNQCWTVTLGPDGLLYAPQTRSDTVVGGLTFDRSVFPVIAVADPSGTSVSVSYFPDLLVVPPHRPVEVAVDDHTIYMASAGSDDVLAISKDTGFAKWHAQKVGLEPGAIVLDQERRRLYVLTITGQQIVALDAESGDVISQTRFTNDPTPPEIIRGRYLFGTATDKRLTKDQWMSCAVCHPDGDEDGRQWDFGDGSLDTRSLRGCMKTTPLHITAHLDEIQDTYHFTRMVMAGQWFVPHEAMHNYLGKPNSGLDTDLDALAKYIESLEPKKPPDHPSELSEIIEKGKEIFFDKKTDCARCHPPPFYTDSGKREKDGDFLKHDVGTRLQIEGNGYQELDTPALMGLHRSEPYLHDGRAKTLKEVFQKYNLEDKHGRTSHLDETQINALVEFLLYLDSSEKAG
jgi:DNA-binding beta-propeller fold protein YncE